jgi:hypothetical protein
MTQIVAHQISIPISFYCEVKSVNWEVGSARLLRWHPSYGDGGWDLETELVSPSRHTPLRQFLQVGDLPAELTSLLPEKGVKLSNAVRKVEFQVIVGVRPEGRRKRRRVDPWKMRGDFLSLEHPLVDTVRFLNEYGAWGRGTEPRPKSGSTPLEFDPVIVPPLHIWKEQAEIRQALVEGAGSWFRSHKSPSNFYAQEKFPHYTYTDHYCSDAIATSITLDFLRDMKFALCLRNDCHKPFSVKRKGKLYCSQYCAHLVSVRKSRSQKKAI